MSDPLGKVSDEPCADGPDELVVNWPDVQASEPAQQSSDGLYAAVLFSGMEVRYAEHVEALVDLRLADMKRSIMDEIAARRGRK
jgi:hypothetical protein